MRRTASSLISSISSADSPGSMRAYLSDRYSLSMCCFMRKLFPLKVRSTSNTVSPTRKPRSVASIFTSLFGTQSPLK